MYALPESTEVPTRTVPASSPWSNPMSDFLILTGFNVFGVNVMDCPKPIEIQKKKKRDKNEFFMANIVEK